MTRPALTLVPYREYHIARAVYYSYLKNSRTKKFHIFGGIVGRKATGEANNNTMRLLHCSLAVFLLLVVAIVEAKDYDTRREELIVSALSTPDTNPTGIAPIQAYVVGETVPQSSIDALLENITTDPKADFRIVQLLRIMLLDPSYTSQILPTLSSPSLKYWLTPDDDVRVYWSENHHSMWMSSAWLLQEQFGVDVQDATLKTRLTTYLQVKIQYGFYEFGSTLYLPYTLTGLLNLVDFCQDATIQDLAAQAALRLLQDILLLVNSEGVLFPAAGRNIVRMYLIPYDSNYNSIVWLLTGLGEQPKTVYHVGAFLLSSTLDVSSLEWTPTTNTVLNIGHDLDSTDTIYKDLTRVDRTLAQWSFGGYFHPDTIDDTRALLDSYDLQDHEEFEQFQAFTSLPSGIANLGILEQITKSTVIVKEQIRVFRDGPVTLSSAARLLAWAFGLPTVAVDGSHRTTCCLDPKRC